MNVANGVHEPAEIPIPRPGKATRRYLGELGGRLRMHGLSGTQAGEILAQVETHMHESGEDPVDAFGTPKQYAASYRGPDAAPWWRSMSTWLSALAGAGAGFLLASGAVGAAMGEPTLGLPAWVALGAGVVLTALLAAFLPLDRIIDPRRPDSGGISRAAFTGIVLAIAVVIAAAFYGLGVLLD